MASAVWSGSISLGMVVVPVRLYPAIRKQHVRFHELDRTGRRVRHVRVAEPEPGWQPESRKTPPWVDTTRERQEPGATSADAGAPPPNAAERPPASETELEARPAPAGRAEGQLDYGEIRKGYEVAPGEYVTMTRDEVAALAPERSRVIDVEQFVDVRGVDPIYFDSRYYVVPERDSAPAFAILRKAMADLDRMAVGWFTLRSRRHLCAIRAHGEVMLLTTLVHADEVLPADFAPPVSEPTERELSMARPLIETLSGPFEPARYPDEHRRRLLDAIAARTPVRAAEPAAASPSRVLDLMAALEASVKAAKAAKARQRREHESEKPRRRRSRGA